MNRDLIAWLCLLLLAGAGYAAALVGSFGILGCGLAIPTGLVLGVLLLGLVGVAGQSISEQLRIPHGPKRQDRPTAP